MDTTESVAKKHLIWQNVPVWEEYNGCARGRGGVMSHNGKYYLYHRYVISPLPTLKMILHIMMHNPDT